jgi:hypothetical protein
MVYKAAGCLLYSASTKRFCFQLRNNNKSKVKTWGTWGGQLNPNEKPFDGLMRELSEEMSREVQISKIIHLNTYRNNEFTYTNYLMLVRNEFIPQLNKESNGYCWVDASSLPVGLHQGAKRLFENDKIRKKIDKTIDNYSVSKALYDYVKREQSAS